MTQPTYKIEDRAKLNTTLYFLSEPMQAIEFKTILHNGTVTIPPQYSPQWEGKAIRVILLEDKEVETVALENSDAHPLLARLRQIKISAPADFSENLDAYLNEEKNV
ncbi:MAG: hypothetical protein AB4426_20910 [Xenococcaceae cyanobacterium]